MMQKVKIAVIVDLVTCGNDSCDIGVLVLGVIRKDHILIKD